MLYYLSISHRLLTKYLNDGLIYPTKLMKDIFPSRFEYINDTAYNHIPLLSEKIFFDETHIILELDLSNIKSKKYYRILPITIINSMYCYDDEKKQRYLSHIRDVENNITTLLPIITTVDENEKIIDRNNKIGISRTDKNINQNILFYFQLMGGISYLKTSNLFTKSNISSISLFYKKYINTHNNEEIFNTSRINIPWQIALFHTLKDKKALNDMLFDLNIENFNYYNNEIHETNKDKFPVLWKTFLLFIRLNTNKQDKDIIEEYIESSEKYPDRGVRSFNFKNFKDDIVKLDKDAISFKEIVENYSLIENDKYLPIFILLCIRKHPSLSKKSSDSESIKNLIKAQSFNLEHECELLGLTLFFIGVYFGYGYIRNNQNIIPDSINHLDIEKKKEIKKMLKVKINPFSYFEKYIYEYYIDNIFNTFKKERKSKIHYGYETHTTEVIESTDNKNLRKAIITNYSINSSNHNYEYFYFDIKTNDLFEETINLLIKDIKPIEISYKKNKDLIISILDLAVYDKSFMHYLNFIFNENNILTLSLNDLINLINFIKDNKKYKKKDLLAHLNHIKTNLS